MNIWTIHDTNVDMPLLEQAAAVLRAGGLVAFPTETVYGLGANAMDEAAVRRIFHAKVRPADNPLIVHLASASQLDRVVADVNALPPTVLRAVQAFWPGPLTVLVPAHPDIAPSVHPGTPLIGVRVPDHPIARRLIALADCPVAAPSANKSGRPSPTTAHDVVEDLDGVIDGLVDGGACSVGLESTVVDIGAREAVIYRPGGISKEQLESVLGIPVRFDAHLIAESEPPKAPGMKYRHYAPNATVHVWWGDSAHIRQEMDAFERNHSGERIARITPAPPDASSELTWSPSPQEEYTASLSRMLYQLLRQFDRAGAQHILIWGVEPEGLGAALMNRLRKAAEGRLTRV